MISHERLEYLLKYNPKTGKFTWKNPTSNKIKKGSKAGTLNEDGYIIIRLDGKNYRAHRLAYFYVTRTWPTEIIDHKNTIRHDNSWLNLRHISIANNNKNTSTPITNTSGIKGVYWCKTSNRWIAQIYRNSKRVYLGSFTEIDKAQLTIQQARQQFHGEYCNHG